jgi:hypothetical protein|tara:strand:- start:709 stop:942 length:234 start_codon:yes stop_codon:yes gene_type:complete
MLGMQFVEENGDFISTNAYETVFIVKDMLGDWSVQCPTKMIDEIGFVDFDSAKRFAEQHVVHTWNPGKFTSSNRELS